MPNSKSTAAYMLTRKVRKLFRVMKFPSLWALLRQIQIMVTRISNYSIILFGLSRVVSVFAAHMPQFHPLTKIGTCQ